jgi:small subunit ribosomal protein S16
VGSKKNAIWRVVVADQRSPRDGRFIEMIGHYNPQTQPSQIVIDEERLQHWLERGAQPSNTVKKLMRATSSDAGAATAVADAPQEEAPAAEVESPPAETEGEAGTGGEEAAADADAGPDAGTEAQADSEAAAGDEKASDSDAGSG